MAELFQLVEEALDEVALAVDGFGPSVFPLAVCAVRNVGYGALSTDARANAIGVIALVGDDDGARREPIEQGFGGGHVMVIARRDQQADRPALRVDARMDFRREPSPASTDTTNSTLFLTPEAC